ncbi:hypothetical protein BO94DRAFT_530646 [Aspergillus sclerotioniger CBS 115572]|uniref:Uncharacterized protein n=1 Tax=Aspergillus sclerotioniger CBS 115572 TaxID=1450535 RepID=A0A317XBG6_9EURO|nr:hypothetical protein BO94DRAFT_530646 [Aspergillus sclerotioniger CBS 115572]PWY95906.1 hypothetical protein BO94DRAFT_530646 [Aspergillus sclerotioniger CBS 115572]
MTSPTDADQTMQQSLQRFRNRMAAANRKFIQDRIDEIEARGLATERQKWRKMVEYRHFDMPDENEDLPKRLVDLPTVVDTDPFAMDGVHPPRLRTEKAREIILDTLQQVFQRQAEKWAAEQGKDTPGLIPRCDELGMFLKYAHAVEDPDFRLSSIPPFEAGLWVMGADEAELVETQPERYYERVRAECERVRENLEDDDGIGDLINKSMVAPRIEGSDLEVKAGVITGTGYIDEYPHWFSAYLYCRQRVDADEGNDTISDAPNIQDWAWRVVVVDSEPDILNPTVMYGRRPQFDSIPEFLDWYCSWPDHLDTRGILSLRRHAIQCETDCESDCEYHHH